MVQTMMRPHRRMKYTCTHILFALSLFDLSFGERSSWPKNTMFTFGGSFSPSLLPSVLVATTVRSRNVSFPAVDVRCAAVRCSTVRCAASLYTAVSCDAFLSAAVRCAAATTTNGSEGHCSGEDVLKERAEHREEGHAVIYVEVGVDEREGEHHEQDKAGQYEQHQLRHGVIGPRVPL